MKACTAGESSNVFIGSKGCESRVLARSYSSSSSSPSSTAASHCSPSLSHSIQIGQAYRSPTSERSRVYMGWRGIRLWVAGNVAQAGGGLGSRGGGARAEWGGEEWGCGTVWRRMRFRLEAWRWRSSAAGRMGMVVGGICGDQRCWERGMVSKMVGRVDCGGDKEWMGRRSCLRG